MPAAASLLSQRSSALSITDPPSLCGRESEIQAVLHNPEPIFLPYTQVRSRDIAAGVAIALQMHQPTLISPTHGHLVSRLQVMFERPFEGDNHQAGTLTYCYGRMGDFIPELLGQGCYPRIMLAYSGALLWGLQQLGRQDILGKLRRITQEAAYFPYVEWLGTFWGHASVVTTPTADVPLHIRAWQHQFADLFGLEALARVRGFAPPQGKLPAHPDRLYQFVSEVKAAGYRWLLVASDQVEAPDGEPLRRISHPYRLVVRNTQGDVLSIAILLTPSAPTSGVLPAYARAKTLAGESRVRSRVSLCAQMTWGDRDLSMINEFPSAFKRTWHEIRQQGGGRVGTIGLTGTEYLEVLESQGYTVDHYLPCQVSSQRNRQRAQETTVSGSPNDLTSEQLTVNAHYLSDWLEAVYRLSDRFHQTFPASAAIPNSDLVYRQALVHHLSLQSADFQTQAETLWREHGQEMYRQGNALLADQGG